MRFHRDTEIIWVIVLIGLPFVVVAGIVAKWMGLAP